MTEVNLNNNDSSIVLVEMLDRLKKYLSQSREMKTQEADLWWSQTIQNELLP